MVMSQLFVFFFAISQAADLRDIPIYTLEDGETYYLRAEYCTLNNTVLTMSGRCYSFSSDGTTYTEATSPGPTLKLIAGTNPTVILVNDFINTATADHSCSNDYCSMDNTNLHTHGVHISSSDDDVLVNLDPKSSSGDAAPTYTYSYHIISDHYPGVHWYHPHKHGSVSGQIHFGLFGAIITEYSDTVAADLYPDLKLYNDGSAAGYVTDILSVSFVYAVNTDLCVNDCTTVLQGTVSNAFEEGIGAYASCARRRRLPPDNGGGNCFKIFSACYEWCGFDDKDTSDFEYVIDISDGSNTIEQYFFVNGDFNPTVTDITAGAFRRLLFVNVVDQYYVHYNLPDACDWFLLGYDGIFFGAERDLSAYENELLLSPGGRADVLVKCDTVGQYQITTISDGESAQTDIDASLAGIERAGSDSVKDLFMLNVVQSGADVLTELPTDYPPKPDYLQDLTSVTVDSTCACNQFDAAGTNCPTDECCIAYKGPLNGEAFSSAERYLSYMIKGGVYEYTLDTGGHVHHQHVYPFQIQNDVANGFAAESGDYFDTFGGAGANTHIRMITADFSGYMMVHCHLLPHEDVEGMMGIIYVIDDDSVTLEAYSGPSLSPTQNCLDELIDDWTGEMTSPTEENGTASPTQAIQAKSKGKKGKKSKSKGKKGKKKEKKSKYGYDNAQSAKDVSDVGYQSKNGSENGPKYTVFVVIGIVFCLVIIGGMIAVWKCNKRSKAGHASVSEDYSSDECMELNGRQW